MASSEAGENKVDALLARLAEIVQEVDMDITTQRQITNKLAEEFGEDVYEYKALIKVVFSTSYLLQIHTSGTEFVCTNRPTA